MCDLSSNIKKHMIDAFGEKRHRLLLEAGMRSNFYFCFTINYEQAKAFRNANGQYLRQSQWEDITVEVIF